MGKRSSFSVYTLPHQLHKQPVIKGDLKEELIVIPYIQLSRRLHQPRPGKRSGNHRLLKARVVSASLRPIPVPREMEPEGMIALDQQASLAMVQPITFLGESARWAMSLEKVQPFFPCADSNYFSSTTSLPGSPVLAHISLEFPCYFLILSGSLIYNVSCHGKESG